MEWDELEEAARQRLPSEAWDYYAGGADDESTLADNVAAWGRLRLRPHVLRDVTSVRTDTRVLGAEVAFPVLVAPTAYHRLADDEGELATARAAARAGTVMVASTLATVALEDTAAVAPDAARWFQLYVRTDRGWTEELVRRAVAAGYRAIVLTVDLPVPGWRARDERNNFTLPAGMHMANLREGVPTTSGSSLAAYATAQFAADLTPDDIGWLAEVSGLPIVVKGVVRADDAEAAVAAGAAGVVVSNHGGRQLDGCVATADALGEVAAAVGGSAEVYADGGVRRGTDVVRALALGARAVLVGRPVLWGLAVGGEDGVLAVLSRLHGEVQRAMTLCGARDVGEVTRDLIASGG